MCWACGREDAKVAAAAGASLVVATFGPERAEREAGESGTGDTAVVPSGAGGAEVDEAIPGAELATLCYRR